MNSFIRLHPGCAVVSEMKHTLTRGHGTYSQRLGAVREHVSGTLQSTLKMRRYTAVSYSRDETG